MKKLYCFVDETGQDTKGEFFLVSVVITEQDKDLLEKIIQDIELQSGKRKSKWHKTSFEARNAFLGSVLLNSLFKGKIFFSEYTGNAYVELTILSVAKAINQYTHKDSYKATIIVDGLRKKELRHFSSGLRKLNIRIRKVRGARDESDALIRLADAMAGFLRDYHEQQSYTNVLMSQAISNGIVVQV